MIPEKKRLPESALDIHMPNRRAKRCTPPRRDTTPPPEYLKNQSDREKWMREKQAKKRRDAVYHREQVRQAANRPTKAYQRLKEEKEAERIAPIEGKREAQLLAEAEATIRRRRLIEQTSEGE